MRKLEPVADGDSPGRKDPDPQDIISRVTKRVQKIIRLTIEEDI